MNNNERKCIYFCIVYKIPTNVGCALDKYGFGNLSKAVAFPLFASKKMMYMLIEVEAACPQTAPE